MLWRKHSLGGYLIRFISCRFIYSNVSAKERNRRGCSWYVVPSGVFIRLMWKIFIGNEARLICHFPTGVSMKALLLLRRKVKPSALHNGAMNSIFSPCLHSLFMGIDSCKLCLCVGRQVLQGVYPAATAFS